MAGQADRQTRPVGRVLTGLMEGRDMSDAELAFRIGVSTTTVQRWRAGRNEPTPGTARRLAELFGVDWRDFYDERAAA